MTAARSRRGPLKGRSWVAIGLLAFVAVAGLVVWRRSVGVSSAKAMSRAEVQKRVLLSEKITLQRDISDAQMRTRVISEAERRLGLHVAPDAQSRVLPTQSKEP